MWKHNPPVKKKALVLGFHSLENDEFHLTDFAQRFNNSVNGRLNRQLACCGLIECGQVRLFSGMTNEYGLVGVVGLGNLSSVSPIEEINRLKEHVRIAASVGARSLQERGIQEVDIEDLGCAQSAAEGAVLGTFLYQENLKNQEDRLLLPNLKLVNGDNNNFVKGMLLANAQNWTRTLLMDIPAQLLTPYDILVELRDKLEPLGIEVRPRYELWLKTMGMNAFLSVSNDLNGHPFLVELHNKGGSPDMKPIVMIGQGITLKNTDNVVTQPSDDMVKL